MHCLERHDRNLGKHDIMMNAQNHATFLGSHLKLRVSVVRLSTYWSRAFSVSLNNYYGHFLRLCPLSQYSNVAPNIIFNVEHSKFGQRGHQEILLIS